MREVIKIAFRRENIDVVAYPDAATALTNIEQGKPDVVITDVIMPDKDGYEGGKHIKQHPRWGGTRVILMSGVVNRAVAEKAFSVKADELIRKPFQPQDLITRVKHLLKTEEQPPAPAPANAAAALSSIFAAPANGPANRPRPPAAAGPPTLASPVSAPTVAETGSSTPVSISAPAVGNGGPAKQMTNSAGELAKLKLEIAR